MSAARGRRISFDDEPLILVDEDDNVIGHAPKADVHAGQGTLHRAFSVFLFDEQGRVLLQQRSASKPLWPLYWSNACCSHPRRGETVAAAARRRVSEELGLDAALEYLYTFTYHATFENKGAEHEVCSVFLGRIDRPPETNENEIAELAWLTAAELDRALAEEGARYTPWLQLEWARLRARHAEQLAPYVGT